MANRNQQLTIFEIFHINFQASIMNVIGFSNSYHRAAVIVNYT